MNKPARNTVFLMLANVALGALVLGCSESVPQRSAEGGILSGTDVERNRYASRKNPLLAGNAPQEVQASASSSPLLNPPSAPTPRSTTGPTGSSASPAAPAGSTAAPPPSPAEGAGTTAAPEGKASESGGSNPPGGVTSGTVPGGPETTTGGKR